MQPQNNSDYKKILTELIKKQIVVLGPAITLAKVRNVQGLEVDNNGEVTNITGDPQTILQNLINQFVELSGTIVKKTTESILSAYPEMAEMAAKSLAQNVSTQQQQVKPATQPQNNTSQSGAMRANSLSHSVSQQDSGGSSNSNSDLNNVGSHMNQENNSMQNQNTQNVQNFGNSSQTNQNVNHEQSSDNSSSQSSSSQSSPESNNKNQAQASPAGEENTAQMSKEEINNINEALSQLQNQAPNPNQSGTVENDSNNVQQSDNKN